MIIHAFAVHDSKAELFTKPFFEVTVGTAVRAFSDSVNSEGSDFHRHAEDFTLFHVGSFDDAMGVFVKFDAPVSLGNAVTFVLEV